MTRKQDAEAIERFWDSLPQRLGLDQRRLWWPKYLYRFDDIRAVAEILKRGAILSREKRDAEGMTAFHSANAEVIANTPHLHCNARLYFRPLTPTQYHMEGVLAKTQIRATGEHCPIPAFLCFDARYLLCEDGVRFTDSAPTRIGQYHIGDDAEFLAQINFDLVYHDGPITADMDKRMTIATRQAEVFADSEISLDHLAFVVCRTGPERDTLLYLLGTEAAAWEQRIRVASPGMAMFNRRGMFVESAQIIGRELHVRMPPRGYLYDSTLEVRDADTNLQLYKGAMTQKQLPPYWKVELSRAAERVLVVLAVEEAPVLRAVLSQTKLVSA